MLIKLARLSLMNRRGTVTLTLISLMISFALVLGIDHLRKQAKQSFSQTLSGTDLIVGARGGQLNLLLYSVFRLGNATNNISWKSYQELTRHSAVAWAIPLSLGDSHRGYRVMGTTPEYFKHYRYGRKQSLVLREGKSFDGIYSAVLGAEVARSLGYEPGEEIVLAHGSGAVNLHHHDEQPFTVTGILAATGTPVDRTIHISLAGMEAIHLDWQHGLPIPGNKTTADDALHHDLTPVGVTAVLVGLKSRATTLTLQRQVNTYKQEPLLAILPGVALAELWQLVGVVENLLLVIALMVLVASLIGMMTSLLAAMNERQREIAILRAVGASPLYIFMLVEIEVILLASLAILGGFAMLAIGLWFSDAFLAESLGLFIETNPLSTQAVYMAVAVICLTALMGAIPAIAAYRRALHDGLAQRL